MTTYDFYWAAPLFTQAEKDFNFKGASIIESLGFKVFLPQRDNRHALIGGHSCYEVNKECLIRSKSIIAVVDGPDVDSGTAWEVGYFSALIETLKKPMGDIFLLRTDFREASDGAVGVNLMVSESITVPIIFRTLDELFSYLVSFKVKQNKGE
jgi:nucleoside 2-deoxyribosyltransferase